MLRAAAVGGKGNEGGSTAAGRALIGVAGADALLTMAAGGAGLIGAEIVLSDIEWRCCAAGATWVGSAVEAAVGVEANCCCICRAGCGTVSGGGSGG